MKNEKTMIRWLWGLRVFLLLNVGLFIFLLFNTKYWKIYFLTNAFFILGYIWFSYIRVFLSEFKKTNYFPLEQISYSVVIPCYNEETNLISENIKSIVEQTDSYKKELIIVDDGSTNRVWNTLIKLKEEFSNYDITLLRFFKNKGKRFAHEIAFKKAKYDFIVSIDSDTILAKDSIYNLLMSFSDKEVGATTGNILLKNEKCNMLTRIQAGLYWIGLNIYKKGQSFNESVLCCSGCLSAYRKSDLIEILDEYVNQEFLGNTCHASEDRFLTNLINQKGKKVVYAENAICYTDAPVTLSKFIKQQLRWKRGFYREALYTITYMWKKSKVVYLENLIASLFTPYFNLSMRILAIYSMIFKPLFFLTILLPSWILFVVCRDSLLFVRNYKKGIGYLPYLFIYNTLLYPLNLYAIFMTKPEKWGTR